MNQMINPPVPVEPFIVEPVEEVRLCAHGSDVGMHAQELEQSARAALLHADNDGLGKLFIPETVGYRQVGNVPGKISRLFFSDSCKKVSLVGRVPVLMKLAQSWSALVQRNRCEIAVSGQTVEHIGDQNNHGEEHGHSGGRFQVQVKPCRPTSHG